MIDRFTYKVYDQSGRTVLSAPPEARHDKETELHLLNSNHTIKLDGKRITKKEVEKR